MVEVDIGLGKSARRAFGFGEISIVPTRRTRDPEDVDVSWELDAYRLEVPVLASAMDSVVSPATAAALGGLGAAGALHLEGLWARHEDPEPLLAGLAGLEAPAVAARLAEAYAAPVQPTLVAARLRQLRESGVLAVAGVSPQRTEELLPIIRKAEPDLLVIHGPALSAEHVSRNREPLNLKHLIRRLELPVIVGGCASYRSALHLMRTGAVGVLVGVGPGSASATSAVTGVGVPQATAIADVRAARMRHLDETGVYVHVIADGGMRSGADVAKAIVCGADAVMLGAPLAAAAEAPGRGWHWGTTSFHGTLPRGRVVQLGTTGTLAEVLLGPAPSSDAATNIVGGLRAAMAACGCATLKELQKADLVVCGEGASW